MSIQEDAMDLQLFSYSRYSSPVGARLPALERNMLKYRTFQMALILFYVEDIKERIMDTIYPVAAESLLTAPKSYSKKLRVAFDYCLQEGIFSQKESKDLQNLIKFRNDIAHRIDDLTADLNLTQYAREWIQFYKIRYDYNALSRLTYYRDCLWQRVRRRFVISLSDRSLVFEGAEKTYKDELKRLKRLIDSQYVRRKREVDSLNAELSLEGTGLVGDDHPRHPKHRTSGGRLTRHGVEMCNQLFDLGKSPMAVAYIVGMTYRAALRRYKQWQDAGGQQRQGARSRHNSSTN